MNFSANIPPEHNQTFVAVQNQEPASSTAWLGQLLYTQDPGVFY
jgi:hypothetical protein